MTGPADHDPREILAPRDLRPSVALPREAAPIPLLIGIALVLGLALFLYLDAGRRAMQDSDAARRMAAIHPGTVPQLVVPPAPPAPALPPPVIIHDQPALAMNPAPAQPPALRMRQPMPSPVASRSPEAAKPRGNEPALVVDLTTGNGAAVNAGNAASGGAAAAMTDGDETARATIIRNRGSVIPQGAIIAAVLETPLNSDRPGLARAIVSHDARSFDGTRVLIPRGSRLIGEFKADTSPGMRRILVTWTRLIRPDGVAIRIGSPVADSLGGAGVPGTVNTHFLERFASAVLQSALTIGVNVASALPVNGGSIYVGLPAQAAQVGQQLVPNSNRPPTVKVAGGAQIAVLVARDLDFSGTPAVR